MSGQDIQKLQAELESLRKENQQLKVVAYRYVTPETQDPYEPPVIEKEPILNALAIQLGELRQTNQLVKNALQAYEEVQGSLEALIPALELQMKGWANQVEQLQQAATETENAYASVVAKLEEKLKQQTTASQSDPAARRLIHQLRAQLTEQAAQLAALQRSSAPQQDEDDDKPSDNPFTNLNIFDA